MINQDDDLIHRNFLKRCHEAVAGNVTVTMYASALWRGTPETSFISTLMGNTGSVTDYLLKDDVVIVDDYRAATTFLYTKYFLCPADNSGEKKQHFAERYRFQQKINIGDAFLVRRDQVRRIGEGIFG